MQISGPGNIPLVNLTDSIIQRTYHEILVLSDLLPRKTDHERKLECARFASRSRLLFARLLALVKWAKSGCKIDKCMAISNFLDQQALLFVDTADQLAKIARETLVNARLPAFSIPCAVDVLITGTYPRLPTCIRERIIPPDPITHPEKLQTLKRLNQVIEFRLATTDVPRAFQKLKVGHGRVRLRAEHEFEATLTLMGDGPSVPWRLLDIDILVEDPDSGDCTSLVHGMQVQYIHQLVQSRLSAAAVASTAAGDYCDSPSPPPIVDLYNCLHSFCQSLQLEVLHAQAQKLIYEHLNDSIAVESYVPGKHLQVAYWVQLQKHRAAATSAGQPAPAAYRLDVQIAAGEQGKPLLVAHSPKVPLEAGRRWGLSLAVFGQSLSFEKLLLETIHVRSNLKLHDLRKSIELAGCGVDRFALSDVPPTLSFALLDPCLQSERVQIAVDGQLGLFLVSVMQYPECPAAREIQDHLNQHELQPQSSGGAAGSALRAASSGESLRLLLSRCRVWLAVQRCKKTLQFSRACVYDRLPLAGPSVPAAGAAGEGAAAGLAQALGAASTAADSRSSAASQRLYVRLSRQCGFYMVVDVRDSSEPLRVDMDYSLLTVQPAAHDGSVATASTAVDDVPSSSLLSSACATAGRPYLRPGRVLRLFGNHSTRSPPEAAAAAAAAAARGEAPPDLLLTLLKARQAASCYFVPMLSETVSCCEERTAFGVLAEELSKSGLINDGAQLMDAPAGDGSTSIYSLSVLALPPGDDAAMQQRLVSGLAACTFRANMKSRRWIVECLFSHHPLQGCQVRKGGGGVTNRTLLVYDMRTASSAAAQQTVQEFIADWTAMVRLYGLLYSSAQRLRAGRSPAAVVWKADHRRVTFSYGDATAACYLVTVYWHAMDKQFQADFGAIRSPPAHRGNPHSLTAQFLIRDLNSHLDLVAFLSTLVGTARPLAALVSLRASPSYGAMHSTKHSQPTSSFVLLPQSSTQVRAVYRGVYCVDLSFVGGGMVAVRDGAYSAFDSSKIVDGLTPTQGLKAFLTLFAADSVGLVPGRSTGDDDNPPSPTAMDISEAAVPQSQMLQQPRQGTTAAMNAAGSPRRMLPLEAPSPKGGGMAAASPAGMGAFGLASPLDQPGLMDPSPAQHVMTASPAPIMSPVNVPAPSPSFHMSPGTFVSPAFPGGSSSGGGSEGSPFPGAAGLMPVVPPPQMSAPSPKNLPASPAPGTAAAHRALAAMGGGSGVGQSPQHGVPSTQQPSLAVSLASSAQQQQLLHFPPSSSRSLPQRSWAGSVPSLLTDAALEAMLSAGAGSASDSSTMSSSMAGGVPAADLYAGYSPLERFLGSVSMRRQLQRVLQSEEPKMSILPASEPGVCVFRNDSLVYKVYMDATTLQALRLSVKPAPESMDRWLGEELQVLERYFEAKVACPPYKANSLTAFCRLLIAPFRVLRDCIQILRMELSPQELLSMGARWRVEWCLTLPQSVRIAEPGTAATVVRMSSTVKKMLFVLQLTGAASYPMDGGAAAASPPVRPLTIAVPLVYDIGPDSILNIDPRPGGQPGSASAGLHTAVMEVVKRGQQQHQQALQQSQPTGTAIMAVVRELVFNWVM